MRPQLVRERRELARELSLDELTVQCLLNRGISDVTAARAFLRGGLSTLLRPEDLPDMALAVERIRRAVRDGETICVWGDYDVDGISGTAIMTRFLRLLGATVVPFIPDRSGSGYGFHWPTMERLIGQGVTLFISVDHGSASVDPITRAKEAGIDVVVADHHEMAPILPPAVAVINPKRADSTYGFDGLCGAGVAMKLAWAVAQDHSPGARVTDEMREFLLEALGLAVLGTVADVVPLRGENRIIVRHGLSVLGNRPPPGIAALLDVSRAQAPLRAEDIGFRLGPRLNAAGRMGKAELALELLLTDDPVRAGEIARKLDQENVRRRAIEREVAEEARECTKREFGERPERAIVLMGDHWHNGVIGIVASRLVDEFHVPAVLVGLSNGVGKGSARSVRGFALHTALAACSEHLQAHGGHAAAAGLTVEPGRFPAFREAFLEYAAENLDEDQRTPRLDIDAEAEVEQISPGLAAAMDRLEPFGEGNRPPVFAFRRVRIVGRPRRMGERGEHVSFFVGRDGQALRCVAFRQAEALMPVLDEPGFVDVAFTPQRNRFRGRTDVEGLVHDVRVSDGP